MALYDIYKLHITVKHENGKNVFYDEGFDIIDVTAYADDITTEHKQFIVDTMISMGHLTNEASLDDLDVIYVGDCGVGISDKQTGHPLFYIIKRDILKDILSSILSREIKQIKPHTLSLLV